MSGFKSNHDLEANTNKNVETVRQEATCWAVLPFARKRLHQSSTSQSRQPKQNRLGAQRRQSNNGARHAILQFDRNNRADLMLLSQVSNYRIDGLAPP